MLFHLAVGAVTIGACFKWGGWKNWELYYPTILYFIIGDLTAYILLHNMQLWLYEGWLAGYFFADLYYAVFVYPFMIILYLSYFPKRLKSQIAYILLCIALFSAFEFISYLTNHFSYDNNWNILYSIIFNFFMFPLLYLHFKKPLIVWPISMALAFALLYIFKIPLTNI